MQRTLLISDKTLLKITAYLHYLHKTYPHYLIAIANPSLVEENTGALTYTGRLFNDLEFRGQAHPMNEEINKCFDEPLINQFKELIKGLRLDKTLTQEKVDTLLSVRNSILNQLMILEEGKTFFESVALLLPTDVRVKTSNKIKILVSACLMQRILDLTKPKDPRRIKLITPIIFSEKNSHYTYKDIIALQVKSLIPEQNFSAKLFIDYLKQHDVLTLKMSLPGTDNAIDPFLNQQIRKCKSNLSIVILNFSNDLKNIFEGSRAKEFKNLGSEGLLRLNSYLGCLLGDIYLTHTQNLAFKNEIHLELMRIVIKYLEDYFEIKNLSSRVFSSVNTLVEYIALYLPLEVRKLQTALHVRDVEISKQVEKMKDWIEEKPSKSNDKEKQRIKRLSLDPSLVSNSGSNLIGVSSNKHSLFGGNSYEFKTKSATISPRNVVIQKSFS